MNDDKTQFLFACKENTDFTSIKIMYKSFTITMLYDMYYFISMTAIESQEEKPEQIY